jgi:type IX secretion system substrate protein
MKKLYFFILLVSAGMSAQGSLCENPIVISALPFTASDNTANYADNYSPQTTTHPTCSTTSFGNYYHSGNDVIYSYTAPTNGTIKVEMPAGIAWSGMFIYTDCANIGVSYAACATSPSAGTRTINDFPVDAGMTYFIYISSWSTPQTVAYTLNVTDTTLGVADFQHKKGVVLSPNPASAILSIETDLTITKSVIYNAAGQKTVVQFHNGQIAVDQLPAGFYILELTTDQGDSVFKNFVKSAK